jgi:hypothetical protein
MAESKSGGIVSIFSMYSEFWGEIDANLFNYLTASSEWNHLMGNGSTSSVLQRHGLLEASPSLDRLRRALFSRRPGHDLLA